MQMNLVKKYKLWFAISILVILIGVIMFFVRGLNIGIDFVGGTTVSIEMGKQFDKVEVDEILSKYSSDATTNIVN